MLGVLFTYSIVWAQDRKIYVSPGGKESAPGTSAQPVRTLQAALAQVKLTKEKKVTILFRTGTYFFENPVVINPELLAGHSLKITAANNETVVFSGALPLKPVWKQYNEKIQVAEIGPGLALDQLYCDDRLMNMARYPNFDSTQRIFNGTAADALNKERVDRWKNPRGGYIHALHQGEWGGFHFEITGKDDAGKLSMIGGYQNNRPSPMHFAHRFVENIFEELDAPGEWYYNKTTGALYVYPDKQTDPARAAWSYSTAQGILVLKGSADNPLQHVTVSGITFRHTARTFMFTNERLLRSDWAIYRGGAILLEGTTDCLITKSRFIGLGGNAVFVSGYNRNVQISENLIRNIGASAIAFIGNTAAVRSPVYDYSSYVELDKMDREKGPVGNEFPARCTAYNNLIDHIGYIEKQVAGVTIDMAQEILVSHNTIYNVPRAGINIGDGCWGGHVIENNDVFRTVLETGDHGAFNSWGRDRFWRPSRDKTDADVAAYPELPFLDVIKPITLRGNRFHCTHGWDIDLDDGSSNYHIYNNVCLSGGLKLREGYRRLVENNIIINNSFHPHVWLKNSGDIFRKNIVSTAYAPIGMKYWGAQIDSNFFVSATGLEATQKNNTDAHSISGDPLFVGSGKADFSVNKKSPALQIGFVNFPMNKFGVVSLWLIALADKIPIPEMTKAVEKNTSAAVAWGGAKMKNIDGLGERSTAGIFDENGVLVIAVAGKGAAAGSGLRVGDVIRKLDGTEIKNVAAFIDFVRVNNWKGQLPCTIIRNQKEEQITLFLK